MIFYHFTAVHLLEQISCEGLNKGHLTNPDGSIAHSVVWLTTDNEPVNHGLLNGDEHPTPEQLRHASVVEGRTLTNNSVFANKKRARITICLPKETRTLKNYVNFLKKSGQVGLEWAQRMGISAIDGFNANNSTKEDINKLSRKLNTKEKTWYLHFGTISPENFKNIEVDFGNGYAPYNFELHGRRECQSAGIFHVASGSREILSSLIQPAHRYDRLNAIAAWMPGYGAVTIFNSHDLSCVVLTRECEILYVRRGNPDPNILSWIAHNNEELIDLAEMQRASFAGAGMNGY